MKWITIIKWVKELFKSLLLSIKMKLKKAWNCIVVYFETVGVKGVLKSIGKAIWKFLSWQFVAELLGMIMSLYLVRSGDVFLGYFFGVLMGVIILIEIGNRICKNL